VNANPYPVTLKPGNTQFLDLAEMTDGGTIWSPERRDALLGTPVSDSAGGADEGQAAAQEHLTTTRAISAERARRVVKNGRCDECRCALGEAAAIDDCECPCHCDCCCPPLVHCMLGCKCTCNCHYSIDHPEDGGDRETQVDAEQRSLAESHSDDDYEDEHDANEEAGEEQSSNTKLELEQHQADERNEDHALGSAQSDEGDTATGAGSTAKQGNGSDSQEDGSAMSDDDDDRASHRRDTTAEGKGRNTSNSRQASGPTGAVEANGKGAHGKRLDQL
jgi:hypothetical protein